MRRRLAAAAVVWVLAAPAAALAAAIAPSPSRGESALGLVVTAPPQPRVTESVALGEDREESVLAGLSATGARVLDAAQAPGLAEGDPFSPGAGQAIGAPPPERDSQLIEVLRLYANVVPGEGRRGAGGGGSPGFGLGTGVLTSSADAELARLVGTVLRPTVEADGRISFSVFGVGSFALAVSEDRSRIGIIDLDRGAGIVLPAPRREEARAEKPDPWAEAQHARPPVPARRTTTREFLQYLGEAVLDPFKVGIVVAALVIWAFVRARGRSA